MDARHDEGSHLSPVSRGRHSLTITAEGSVGFSLKQWKLAVPVEGGDRRDGGVTTSNKATGNASKLSGGKCPSLK